VGIALSDRHLAGLAAAPQVPAFPVTAQPTRE
jgi:hypothetical protein